MLPSVNAVKHAIKKAVAAQLGLAESEVLPGLRFDEHGDGVDKLEILAAACDILDAADDLFLTDEEEDACVTVGDLIQVAVEYIEHSAGKG